VIVLRNWSVALPLSILALVVASCRTHVSVVDGPDQVLVGFPLYWHWPNGAISLAEVIDLGRLSIDIVFYAAVTSALLALPAVNRRLVPRLKLLTIVSWLLALCAAFLLAAILSFDPEFVWFEAPYLGTELTVVSRKPALAFPAPGP
jgi:hypothetical protein